MQERGRSKRNNAGNGGIKADGQPTQMLRLDWMWQKRFSRSKDGEMAVGRPETHEREFAG